MHQSIPAAPIPPPPPPPGSCGAFSYLVSPGGEALANLAWPGGRAFAYPGATPGLLTRMWFPTLNSNMEDFIRKDQQFGRLACPSKLMTGLTKLWRCSRFYALISSLLIKAQLELSGTINVNRCTYATLIMDFII